MAEYTLKPQAPSDASLKIIVTTDKRRLPAKFLRAEEEKMLKSAIKEQKFAAEGHNFAEICTGKHSLLLAYCPTKATALDWQILGGRIYKKSCSYLNIAIILPPADKSGLSTAEAAGNLVLGMELGGYRFDKYFTKKPADSYPKLEKVTFVTAATIEQSTLTPFLALASSVRYGRDLCNEPANVLTPAAFAEDIKRLEYLGIKVTILADRQLDEMKMLLSVAQGSVNPPRVAVLEWQGDEADSDFTYGLVGKGVTFDSGGISLKPAANMGDMKGDMTGAAVVVSTIKAAALQKLPQNIVGIVGLVENMPSGSATRPGDIVTSMSGQTVEIVNTDAEGRLVLGDCLWYLQSHFAPKSIIDIATLTGSTMMTFGFEYAGLFANSDKLAERLQKCGLISGEKLWRLPINKEYDKLMDSDVADMKNTGPRLAGGITAACFLQRFVKEKQAWAHLDIAGVDRDDKGHPLTPKGATAFGIRLLNCLIAGQDK